MMISVGLSTVLSFLRWGVVARYFYHMSNMVIQQKLMFSPGRYFVDLWNSR